MFASILSNQLGKIKGSQHKIFDFKFLYESVSPELLSIPWRPLRILTKIRRDIRKYRLKVPKCEIFDLFDFNYFYVMKSL